MKAKEIREREAKGKICVVPGSTMFPLAAGLIVQLLEKVALERETG